MFDACELAAATGGWWWLGKSFCGKVTPVTDTRGDLSGKVFFAIKGERFDGHDFLAAAQANGAAAAVANAAATEKCRDLFASGFPVLLVPDTLAAYQAAGRAWRNKFPDLAVCSVTGSVGKTATKEMLRAIFSAAAGEDEVLATSGNTNNQIGVPLNLLKIKAKHKFAVIEMGTNHHGEIEKIASLTDAGAAIVTAIAQCHLEHLGNLDGVAFEKGHIFSSSRQDAAVVIPVDAAGKKELLAAAGNRHVYTFGEAGSGADMELVSTEATFINPGRTVLQMRSGGKIEFIWNLAGKYLALDACAAALAALHYGITPEVIAAGLANTVLPGMRAKVLRRGSNVWILDAYNANPASMEALLENIAGAGTVGKKLYLVLGDMLELGEGAAEAHRKIIRSALQKFPAAEILLAGEIFASVCSKDLPSNVKTFRKAENIKPVLSAISDGVIALKASHSIGLERALPDDLDIQ